MKNGYDKLNKLRNENGSKLYDIIISPNLFGKNNVS
jgi:hypothetical protein